MTSSMPTSASLSVSPRRLSLVIVVFCTFVFVVAVVGRPRSCRATFVGTWRIFALAAALSEAHYKIFFLENVYYPVFQYSNSNTTVFWSHVVAPVILLQIFYYPQFRVLSNSYITFTFYRILQYLSNSPCSMERSRISKHKQSPCTSCTMGTPRALAIRSHVEV